MSACRCGSSEPSPGTTAAPRAEGATRARRPREGPWGRAEPRDRGGGHRRDGPGPSILGLLRGGPKVPYPIAQKTFTAESFSTASRESPESGKPVASHWPERGNTRKRGCYSRTYQALCGKVGADRLEWRLVGMTCLWEEGIHHGTHAA